MRRGIVAAMLFAALFAAGMPVEAQVKLRLLPKQQIQMQMQKPPRVKTPPVMMKPIIPLSRATQLIVQAIPKAKVLKINPLPTGDIVATIRIQDQVRKVRVNGQTGAVQQ
jgi:hypothetical protein